MSDNSLEIQKAIVSAVRGDAAFGAIAGDRIYDSVPDKVTFPFASFGPFLSEPYDGLAMDGWECLVELHVWSRTRGRVQCAQMLLALEAIFHDQPLTLDSANFVLGRLQSQRQLLDGDGLTQHGVQRYRFVTGT